MSARHGHRSVLILGGTGFIGKRIVAQLVGTEWRATLPTRRLARATHLSLLPSVARVVEADIHDDAVLSSLVQGHDAVINLVGILHDKTGPAGSRYGHAFQRVHVELPRRIASACAVGAVPRYLHMSALGASAQAPSMYLRSKADGEVAARECEHSGVSVTVYRPSVVFGPHDSLLNMFARLQKWLPVMLLGGAQARFQPVFVDDVAQAFLVGLQQARTGGQTYELAGPEIYTLRELVKLAGRFSGHTRPVIGLPDSLARLQALLLEWMPGGPLMSRDNLDSMKLDSVAHEPGLKQLGIRPTELESIAPFYLGHAHSRSGTLSVHK